MGNHAGDGGPSSLNALHRERSAHLPGVRPHAGQAPAVARRGRHSCREDPPRRPRRRGVIRPSSKLNLTSTLPGWAWRKALVRALWAMEKRRVRVSVASGGSVPDWDIPVGTPVILSNVEQWDQRTRPSSRPSRMWPASMGPRISHMADRGKLQGCVQGGRQFLVGLAGQFPGPVNAQADHVGGLGGGVVNRLGQLDAFPPELPLPGHRTAPPDAFEPGDETDAQHEGEHHGQPGEEDLLVAGVQVQAKGPPSGTPRRRRRQPWPSRRGSVRGTRRPRQRRQGTGSRPGR